MISMANALATQLSALADSVRTKVGEIYQATYVNTYNFFCAHYIDPVSKTRVTWYLFEDTDENNAGRLTIIFTTSSAFGDSIHACVNGTVAYRHIDNFSSYPPVVAQLLLSKEALTQLTNDNDYPANTYKTYVSNIEELQGFLLMSGVSFDLMSGVPFDLMGAS